MRSKILRSYVVPLLISATYILYLGFEDKLSLYIHPRYIVFTFTMAAIALVLVMINAYFTQKEEHDEKQSLISLIPLGIVLFIALLLPARTLTSATVSQRSIDSGSLVVTAESESLQKLQIGSSKGLKIADWSRLLESNDDASFYKNKPAEITGFVYDAGLGDNTVWVSRFILTCCAVDAQPVGVPVQIENWPAEYEEDEWVRVEGSFELRETNDGQQLVLVPSNIEKVEQPSNPYAN